MASDVTARSGLMQRAWFPPLPGLLVFTVLWWVTFLRVDFAVFSQQQIDELWQSLGSPALLNDPIGSLLVLHTQPPGLNALYAVDLAVTPGSHALLAAIYFLAGLGTILLLVDTLRRVSVPSGWALAAGVVYALLPSTVLYSLWVYVTALMAFLSMLAIWGLAALRSRFLLAITASALAMLGLMLLRPTFAWFVLLAWCAFLFVIVIRRSNGRQRILASGVILVSLLLGLAVQAHHVANFGTLTLSSWSGENVGKGLRTSGALIVTPQARAEIAADACLNSMLPRFEANDLNVYDTETFRTLPGCDVLPRLEARGTAAWDSLRKDPLALQNHNSAENLVTSRKWTEMMTIIVREQPTQLLRMALTSEYGPRNSGLGLYLSPAEDYPFITPLRDALPTAVAGGVLSLLFAPALWTLIVLGWVQAILVRRSWLRGNLVFWAASALLVFHAAANTLAEYSENMRFRAELDAVLLVAGVMALFALWRHQDVRATN
jgi:hypothetical protein